MLEGRNIDVLDGFPIRSASGPGQGLEGVGKVGRGRGNPPQNFDHQVSALMEGGMCGLCCGPGVFTRKCVGENNSECAIVVDCMKVRWFKQTEQNESF